MGFESSQISKQHGSRARAENVWKGRKRFSSFLRPFNLQGICASQFDRNCFQKSIHWLGFKSTTPSAVAEEKMYKILRTSRLYEQIIEQIEGSILSGELKAGDQLPAERELAQKFGVSRTAVREAVKALREKGLVEAYSGRGTFITNGTSQAIRQSLDLMMKIGQPDGGVHLSELRQMLEPQIAALAATRIEEQLLATMREAVVVMDRSLHDPDAYIEADL